MAFTDLNEGILEVFGEAQGSATYAARAQFNARNGFHPCWTDSEKYQAAKARHVCPKCRRPMQGETAHCSKCVKVAVECKKRRCERWKAEGACNTCGGERDCEKTRCASCREKQRKYTARFKAKVGVTHCIDCGSVRDSVNQRCKACRDKRATYRVAYYRAKGA